MASFKSRDFTNLRNIPYEIGERIAQVVFVKLPEIEFTEVDVLSTTERGTGGHGSTGNK